MGRISVDVYPLQVGVPLQKVETFGKYLGGSPSNVAVSAARFGRTSAVITRTGADPFGEYLHEALRGFGVDDRYVTPVPKIPTPVTFCEIFPPDDFPLYFYRYPTAPDLQIQAEELDLDAIRDGGRVLGDGHRPVPGAQPGGDARGAAGAGQARHHRARPRLPRHVLALPRGGARSDRQGAAVRDRRGRQPGRVRHRRRRDASRTPPRPHCTPPGVELAVVKQGPKGVLASDGDHVVEVPPVPVDVVNGLGAGDAFGGALCHALLAGWELERSMRFANAAGAIVAGRLACADAMPTVDEVEAKLQEAVRA